MRFLYLLELEKKYMFSRRKRELRESSLKKVMNCWKESVEIAIYMKKIQTDRERCFLTIKFKRLEKLCELWRL